MTPVPMSNVEGLLKSDYVTNYVAESSTSVLANDFTAVDADDEEDSSTENTPNNMPQMDRGKMGNMGDVTLISYP